MDMPHNKYVEPGKDLDGNPCWFVLEGADLVGIYYSETEAQNVASE
jgi:hypothetical protein